MAATIRVGLIGAGANTKSKHIPGLRAIPGVEITAVCNRRPESTAAAARELGISRTFDRWEDLVADPAIDAIVVGTWPYLHAPIALAALEAGKHLLTEARMCMNAAEARSMEAAARAKPSLVAQIVPSPFGLKGDRFVRSLIEAGELGDLREVTVVGMNDNFGGSDSPLSWRQDAALSGCNMLSLGIVHETLSRWVPPPVRVMAQAHAFVPTRVDPACGSRRPVGTPDSVQVLSVLANGARAVYQFNGVTAFGPAMGITLRGTEGILHYDLLNERITAHTRADLTAGRREPVELTVPAELVGGWRVEADFIDSIRDGAPVRHTDFASGVAYMEFTEAVAKSARDGVAVPLNFYRA